MKWKSVVVCILFTVFISCELESVANDKDEMNVLEKLRVFLRKDQISYDLYSDGKNPLHIKARDAVSSVNAGFYFPDSSVVKKQHGYPKIRSMRFICLMNDPAQDKDSSL